MAIHGIVLTKQLGLVLRRRMRRLRFQRLAGVERLMCDTNLRAVPDEGHKHRRKGAGV